LIEMIGLKSNAYRWHQFPSSHCLAYIESNVN